MNQLKLIEKPVAALVAMLAMLLCLSAHAFELTPKPTNTEAALAKKKSGIIFRASYPLVAFGVHTFSHSVHEGLTQLAYDCPLGTLAECADVNLDSADTGVIVGVRWNDDPPFQFAQGQGNYGPCASNRSPSTVSFSLAMNCWLAHFKDISAKAEANPQSYTKGDGTILARSHFGDLQFLHAMAAQAGTSAMETRRQILMWAEFTWRVQSHNRDESIPPGTRMGAVPVSGMVEHFPAQEERTVEMLFTVGRPWVRHQIRDIAFGSLLHMVQDSFAGGHAARRQRDDAACPIPEIVEFHSYGGQNKTEHKAHDSLESANAKVTASGTALLNAMRELVRLREADATWMDVRPYLEDCVFHLANDAGVASTTVSE